MQFLEDITHPLAVGAAAETFAEAAVRRGAHWVALPDEHDLIAPLSRLVTARDGHRVVPFTSQLVSSLEYFVCLRW